MKTKTSKLPLGYRIPEQLRSEFRQYQTTNTARSLLVILGDYLLIAASAAAAILVADRLHFVFAVLIHLPVGLLIARALRGLEVMVHVGSHYNISRNRKVNDAIANFLCAWPSFSLLSRYRKFHLPHHTRFGTHADPDRARFEKMGFAELSRTRPRRFFSQIFKLVPRYLFDWYSVIGSDPWTLLAGLGSHTLLFLLPLGLIFSSVGTAVMLWLLYIVLPLVLVLPVLRIIAEAAEHNYREDNIFDASYTNDGWVHWLLHPHNDGLHVLHHLVPAIPHHHLRQAQRFLEEKDQEAYQKRMRQRHSIFDNP